MKKSVLSVVLFGAVFIITYMGLCFLVPGFRIKLYAEPMVYFIESISHMVLFKVIISFVMGLIVAAIPVLVSERKRK